MTFVFMFLWLFVVALALGRGAAGQGAAVRRGVGSVTSALGGSLTAWGTRAHPTHFYLYFYSCLLLIHASRLLLLALTLRREEMLSMPAGLLFRHELYSIRIFGLYHLLA